MNEQAGIEMVRYLGTKIIKAAPMTLGAARREHSVVVKCEHGYDTEGYLVEYLDGYTSWSPKAVFEEAYHKAEGFDFGMAIRAAQSGSRIARKGWNGKGMFVYLVEGTTIPVEDCRGACADAVKAVGSLPGASQDICSHFDMMAADGSIIVGWLASQTDMLADDWKIV